MNLPIPWLLDYLDLRGQDLTVLLSAASKRWGLEVHKDPGRALAALFTFAGFTCEGVEGEGVRARLELDVLSNRPDCLGVLGLAREAAAILRVGLKPPVLELKEDREAVEGLTKVSFEEATLCPRYTARIIRGVKVKPSPAWLQERLISMGLTPRNNIVDVTNFILFEMNQPLHAFDLAKLAGRRIVVRRAKPKEPFTPLYGEVPPLTPETLVIADAERPVAIAGIIGGAGSEVGPETTDILLEAAYFDPANTRRTCRRLKVGTDSSYRFERGVDLEAVERISARAAALICEVAGGTVAQGAIDSNPRPRPAKELALRHERLRMLFGAPIPEAETRRILETLGCSIVQETAQELNVRVPSWRQGDLTREADLIEEVARLYGYHHVPAKTDMVAQIPPRSPLETTTDRVRELCTGLGYFECVTDSLIDPRWPAPKVWGAHAPLALDKRSVLREDHSLLRNSLLVSLLSVCRHNQDRRTGVARLFECNKIFLPLKGSPRPEERPALGLVDEGGFAQLADVIRRLESALELDGAHLKWRPVEAGTHPDFLTPETACRVIRVREMDKGERAEDVVGWIGLAAQDMCRAFDLKRTPAVAELRLDALAGLPTAPRRFKPLPSQPEVVRDLAMVVDEQVPWHDLERFAESFCDRDALRDRSEAPRFLSVYRGKQTGAGKKSVAFSVVYRSAERSLTDEEVNSAHQHFVAEILKRFQATIRT